ncbi:MAG: MFS transporter [Burkholderiales bacterium]
MSRSSPEARWFLASVAFWMAPHGIQTVLVPYLMAIELRQSAGSFGITQMVSQAPMLLFLMLGGYVADRQDARRLLALLQALALIMPLLVAVVLMQGRVNEALILVYAATWGLLAAFVMPARDGLLKRVSGVNIQRMVALAMGTQFAAQMAGQVLAGRAAQWGVDRLLLIQAALLLVGVWVVRHLPVKAGLPSSSKATTAVPATNAGTLNATPNATPNATSNATPNTTPNATSPERLSLWRELTDGGRLIATNPVLRATYVITIGMGVFFGGMFLVLMPLAVRDLYDGGAQDLSNTFIAFGLGTLTAIFGMMRLGGARRPGAVLVFSQFLGIAVLTPIAFGISQWAFTACIFCWGMGGGFAMTMSRTIMQEQAPASHQARVMAAFSFATVGGGPIGALITGAAAAQWSVKAAIVVPVVGVLCTTLASLAMHSIVSLRSRSHA